MIRDRSRLFQHSEHMDTAAWPEVDTTSISEPDRGIFLRRQQAIRGWTNHEPIEELGLSRTELYRLLKRCLRLHPDGRIYGFRALIPGKRLKSYERRDVGSTNYSGRFRLFLDEHPEIERTVCEMFLRRGRHKQLGVRPSHKSVHEHFIAACRKAGVGPTEYPLNTVTQAKESLRRYLHRLAETHFVEVAAATGGVEAARRARTSLLNPHKERIVRPYSVVQLDGHKLDLRCVIEIPSTSGLPKRVPLARFWILVALDVASRAIIGYHLCLKPEYGAEDFLYCLRNAITPWEPRQLTIPGLRYPPGSGIPSGVIQECAYALFDTLQVDNARAHLAGWVQERVGEVINCTVNYGPAGSPEDRGFIERYFGTLAGQIHRLPTTTGSNPLKRRSGPAPEQIAQELNVQLEDIEQLLDVLIATYNATEHSSTGYTPLDYLQRTVADDAFLLRHLPQEMCDPVPLLELRVTRKVRGGVRAGGNRYYVEYMYARYQSEVLASAERLEGQRLTLKVNPDDLRVVEAFLPDGSSLGRLYATGSWSSERHSLRTRKRVRRLLRENDMDVDTVEDPISVAIQEFGKRALSNAKAASAYAQLTAESREERAGHVAKHSTPERSRKEINKSWQPIRGANWVTTKKR